MAGPPEKPGAPVPAIVVMIPALSIFQTRWPTDSLT